VCNETSLTGTAFISKEWWHWPADSAKDASGVTVKWRNETTGVGGDAFQSIDAPGLIPVPHDHTWSANIPVGMGPNTILVQATDLAGHSAGQRIVVTKTAPSYEVKGLVRAASGTGLASTLTLDGARQVNTGSSRTGYVISCLLPGDYTLRASVTSVFSYTLTPTPLAFRLVDRDLALQDIVANTFLVSGSVSGSSWKSLDQFVVSVARSDGIGETRDVNQQAPTRAWKMDLPPGNYRLTPGCKYLKCAFNPAYRDVVLTGDTPAVDFEELVPTP
jgi:hypothetical protein